tara:strand:+ start:896 stop:1303 length:408 start_codon:yes stop_codon:yes gene_type:complete
MNKKIVNHIKLLISSLAPIFIGSILIHLGWPNEIFTLIILGNILYICSLVMIAISLFGLIYELFKIYMNKYLLWFLFILSIASLWMALVILTSATFSTQDMEETIYNFIGLCFFWSLFIIIILVLIKYDFFKRKK